MSGAVIVGLQWGDEGKGKIVNGLAPRADMVVRFQGGSNAGHTVSLGGSPIVFHLLPSGISVPGVVCVIGAGVVVDPEALVREIDEARSRGIEIGRNLLVDVGAHMVLPYHKAQEAAEEAARGSAAIGTTRRGIGPAYADRCARDGLPIGLLKSFDAFAERFRSIAERKNDALARLYGAEPVDAGQALDALRPVAGRLRPHLADTPGLVRDAVRSGANVIFEGAQGTLLDLAFGTYPYVTSSHTTSAGVPAGTGVPPALVGEVIGVAKAYVTRVGEGPFPTEDLTARGATIRERGLERGSTTGRSRRCGWLDAVALRFSVDLNGASRLVVTKLDVLDAFDTIPVCVGYSIGGRATDRFPRSAAGLAEAAPIYEELLGWRTSTREARARDELPAEALRYLERIEELTGARVAAVSVGAAPDAIVEFESVLKAPARARR